MTDTNNTDGAALLPVTRALLAEARETIATLDRYSRRNKSELLIDVDTGRTPTDLIAEIDAALSSPLHAKQEDAERSGAGVDDLAHLESEARRFAGFYEPNSDMANTLNIFGNKIAALAASIHPPTPMDTLQRLGQEYDGEAVREALKPFARAAKWWKAFDDQHRITTLHQHGDCLEVGHLRAAEAALAHPAQARDEMREATVQQTVMYHVQFEYPRGIHGDKVWQDAGGYSDTLERARQCLRHQEGYRRKEPLVGNYGRVHLGSRVVRRITTIEETVMPDAVLSSDKGEER